MNMKLLVIIPTYNEIDNISKLIPEVINVIPSNSVVLVVDDNKLDASKVLLYATFNFS